MWYLKPIPLYIHAISNTILIFLKKNLNAPGIFVIFINRTLPGMPERVLTAGCRRVYVKSLIFAKKSLYIFLLSGI